MKIKIERAALARGACVMLMAALAGGCAGTGQQQAKQAAVGGGSSYTCNPTQSDGQATAGRGANGCYFVLHDPATKQVLPNTHYAFALYTSAAQDNQELEVEGTTDAQGRTVYVRSAAPIDAARMVLVRTVGDGPMGRIPVLVRPQDGKRIPFAQYKVTGCNGLYEGVTDETGRGVMYRCKTQSKIEVSFYQSRK
ncbi:TPA: hypothetical protein QDC20_003262 [Burkholderia aenigmatica]|uniref:hypothetical protein n=1 Tax=Burkholderia sp. AU45251 TaxID=3059204 RepID=UPI002656464C|nr:hypothetical protein [Burkholderia sp. AU45251]HDR9481847.1 hypothetical protein [Burkholderia aenigmatica]MDN7513527.1 hypothetical protein [Burkholderia sp. AU45251]HDR9513374.1 hypothetical protein [Burkholderia aenigmatica]HDR9590218.1 hypothetical protein [Burkholderia aenigmatica]HDR9601825.1 hypothetical protein [Burkholderia aenigmatica]